MHILFENQPEYRYEGLAWAVLGARFKYDEPFTIAATDFYDSDVAHLTLKGKRGLSIILTKMIIEHRESPHIQELLTLDDRVWGTPNEDEIRAIVDKAIEIGLELGY
jgi:hypothetical protein